MHPDHLRALTALHDLVLTLDALRQQITAVRLEPAVGLRSTTYGTRYSGGSHTDGVTPHLLAADDGIARWQNLLDHAKDQINQACWLVRSAVPHLPRDVPVRYLAAGLPLVDRRTARDVAGWLLNADRHARRALGTPPPREPLAGVECPTCSTRMLQVATAAPDRGDWTVTCLACQGIWLWTSVIGAERSPELAAA